MYGRYQNGRGNGFRSNATSRISPKGYFNARRVQNQECKNYNRGGYARGGHHSKHFQPPPRETSVFGEAGKLAAKYLVSRGVLPPNALSGKFPVDDLRNLLSNYRGSKPHEAGNRDLDEGRGVRNNGSEVQKLGRSVSWGEKGTCIASPKVEADGEDASVVKPDELRVDKDGNSEVEKSSPGEIKPKVNESDKKSGLEKSDVVVKLISLTNEVNNGESSIMSVDAAEKFCDEGIHIEERNHDDSDKKDGDTKEDCVDLVKACKFVNLPTKTRSSLKAKALEKHRDSTTSGDCNDSKGEISESHEVHLMDVDTDTSSGSVSPDHNNARKMPQADALKDPTLAVEDGVTLIKGQGQLMRSTSFPEGSLCEDNNPGEELLRFASLNAGFLERGGKRAFDDGTEIDQREGSKKLKAFDPSNESNLPPNKVGATKNKIDIIDLENESVEEDKNFGILSDKRVDTVCTDLDGIPSNVHNANGMSDGYGLMMSEFLGNESPSCSSAALDLNSLHDHIDLTNPEGILGDDESIYTSLGEIPLKLYPIVGLLGPWEQSRQDYYGKRF